MTALIVLGVIAFLLLIVVFSSLYTVEQQTAAMVERFGQFRRVARPGLNFKIPFVERVAGRINLRVQQLDVTVETKTRDNVFVHTIVAVQYMVAGTQWVEAHIDLNPRRWVATGLLLALGTGLGALFFGYPFLTTRTMHATLPLVGEVHLPSATFFDLGVFAVVVGATLLILTALAHQSVRAHRQSTGTQTSEPPKAKD